MTPAEEAAMHRTHAAYCRQQQQAREREQRHNLARQWRLDAMDAEAKAAACERQMQPAAKRSPQATLAFAFNEQDGRNAD